MGRIEDLLPKIEIAAGKTTQQIEPQVRKFYQKDGVWYAVVQFVVGENLTSMHVALGAN